MYDVDESQYSTSDASKRDGPDHEIDVLDVLIVGAGPCGLAVAARIREQAPSAMFTDEEHRRFVWLNKHKRKAALMTRKTGKVVPACSEKERGRPGYSMAVLDASEEEWLGRWRRLFDTYDIKHLRSPMLWHVDPQHRDALLSHAHYNGREGELVEIHNCVGKEMSKHQKKKKGRFSGGKKDTSIDINQREQWDYYTPSQSLFCDHCDCVARRYRLDEGLVVKEEVQDIRYGILDAFSVENKVFTVVTDKSVRYARTVILAVGPANAPVLPNIPSTSFPGQVSHDSAGMPQTCHSWHIPKCHYPDPLVQQRIRAGRKTSILVVGGGLTSAQLSDLAIRKGVDRVWHIMRGPLMRKHFDVGLDWMGKFKTLNQGYFHAASDEERLDIIRDARGGGSIPPAFWKKIQPHRERGQLKMFFETVLTEAHFEQSLQDQGGLWRIKTEPPIEDLPAFDFIYFATGIQSDFAALPYLRNMLEDYPIKGFGGFPCLNEDLMWNDEVPLFVTGKLAALKIGPAGPNIGGARIGAERITLALDDFLSRSGPDGATKRAFFAEQETVVGGRRDSGIDMFNYASGTGSKYSSLGEVSE